MSRRNLALALAAVVFVALAAFAVALDGTFVNWDDEWLILSNPFLRGTKHLGEVLNPLADRVLLGAEYLPVRDLSNMVDFRFFGTEAAGYRLGNWLLYATAAALSFAFLLEALKSPAAALAGSLLWAAHPLHAEVVAWASARKDLLNAVFALLAATLLLRAARTGSERLRWAAAGAFLLATLSKSSAAALPAVIALWEAVSGDAAVPFGRRLSVALRRAAPLLAIALAGAAFNAFHQKQGWVRAEWRGGSWLPNLFLMSGVHLRYLRQAFFPSGMAADYALDETTPDAPGNLVGLVLLLAGVGATVHALRRRSRAGFAGAFWFGILAPASNVLYPLTNASADRYLFLPTLGACALGGLAFERALAAGPGAARAAKGALAAAVVVLAVLAAAQARVWRDGVSLWTRATEVSPTCGRAWQNYGEALAQANRVDEALAAFRTMTEVEPRNSALWVHAANRLWQLGGRGKAKEVEAILRAAVGKAEPGMGGPLVALGWVLNETGRTEESVALLQEAVRRQPNLAPAHYNLGLWHLAHKRWGMAAEALERAVAIGMPLGDEIHAHEMMHDLYRRLGDAEGVRRHREERERKKALTWGE
jgi:tetratricopeptide (TPR) repeat protein